MKVSRSLALGAAWIVLVAVALSAWETRSASALPVREDTEVVFGSYHCGADPNAGFVWATFQSSGDIAPDALFAQRSLTLDGNPGEACGALASSAHAVLQSAGCSLGPREERTDAGGASIDFPFVCHAHRSRLVQVLADLGRAVMLSAP